MNPQGEAVVVFDNPQMATNALRAQRIVGRTFARLYSYGVGVFREYVDGAWYVVDKGNLPIKVLDIDRGPQPFCRRSP